MEFNLVHPSLNRIGGAEKVVLEMIRAVSEAGYRVNLFTLDRVDWGKLNRCHEGLTMPDMEMAYFRQLPDLRKGGSWGVLAISYLLLMQRASSRDGISMNNYGEIFPFMTDISYIHSTPLFLSTNSKGENPYQVQKWQIFSKLYELLFGIGWRIERSRFFITNSHFNAHLIEQNTGVRPIVLYPPVYWSNRIPGSDKEDLVLTLSRINRNKRLEIIPEIARRVGTDCKFLILGSTDESSHGVIERICLISREREVVERIRIKENPVLEEIQDSFKRASVYLSTQSNEAFGMAIAEAMAHRCVPIVYRGGGPWHDILSAEQGRYGFSYSHIGEAAKFIERVLQQEGAMQCVRERAKSRIHTFHPRSFRKRFLHLLERIAKRKRHPTSYAYVKI
jgi:glycosyltransferase involved in cell wall biosynthesis